MIDLSVVLRMGQAHALLAALCLAAFPLGGAGVRRSTAFAAAQAAPVAVSAFRREVQERGEGWRAAVLDHILTSADLHRADEHKALAAEAESEVSALVPFAAALVATEAPSVHAAAAAAALEHARLTSVAGSFAHQAKLASADVQAAAEIQDVKLLNGNRSILMQRRMDTRSEVRGGHGVRQPAASLCSGGSGCRSGCSCRFFQSCYVLMNGGTDAGMCDFSLLWLIVLSLTTIGTTFLFLMFCRKKLQDEANLKEQQLMAQSLDLKSLTDEQVMHLRRLMPSEALILALQSTGPPTQKDNKTF